MVKRPYCTILLLLLHALIVDSFSQNDAVIISRDHLDASSMIYSTKLGWQVVGPFYRHLTHQRSTSSLLCRQSRTMSRRDCLYTTVCNNHQRSIVRIWPSAERRSHQSRRWHVTLKSSNDNIEDINRSSSIQKHSNDPYSNSATEASSNYVLSQSANGSQKNKVHIDNSDGGKATHWFTYSLPEGCCVGVLDSASIIPNENKEALLLSSSSATAIKELLHPEEYKWGQTNMSNASSRTSYYLGRVAVRLALKRLLLHDDGNDSDSVITSSGTAARNQKRQLYEVIATNPIQKDSHGRPILPEMVVGSISHKGGECAVGLASFHPLFYDSVDDGSSSSCSSPVDSSVAVEGGNEEVQWREDCPIYYDDEEEDDDESSTVISNNSNRERIGIGVDIEYIDGIRGERVKSRVLTENERNELGGLVEELGISVGEEVMLRFR
eukprot:scaffold4365_cov147-Skeletonema_menzelii.AAC.5